MVLTIPDPPGDCEAGTRYIPVIVCGGEANPPTVTLELADEIGLDAVARAITDAKAKGKKCKCDDK